MDRHCSSTWIAIRGNVRCTCVGSTLDRISENSLCENDDDVCLHKRGFFMVLEAIALSFGVPTDTAGKVLANLVPLSNPLNFGEYVSSLPRMFAMHKGSVTVVSHCEKVADAETVMFVPVRHITKGSVRNICAYCDNVLHNYCHHVRTVTQILNDGSESHATPENATTDCNESHTTPNEFSDENAEDSISRFPLAPVNCAKSLEVDEKICDLARTSNVYVLTAPMKCYACGSCREETSRKMHTEGVIMSSIGPCRMHTEQFRCSSPLCNAEVVSEGREHCIAVLNIASGATHALLRRELYGVVVSNGTLTGRLSHYHSMVTANSFFGVIAPTPACRSVKTLVKLCSVMLKLMCMSPPESLFRCKDCENDASRGFINALCMDGISQGYLKTNSSPFQNISERCVALKPATMATKGRPGLLTRPLTSLVRETKPVSILFDAIRGKSIECKKSNEKSFASAIRMISPLAIPSSFYSSVSVCGLSRGDVSSDIGQNSTLERIQKLVTSVFDESILLLRLLVPILDYVQSDEVRQYLTRNISVLSRNPRCDISRNVTCWSVLIWKCNDDNITNDIFNLTKLLIQGPILQFLKKSDATSLKRLTELCAESNFAGLDSALRNPGILLDGGRPGDTNILSSLNILRAGLFSVVEVERRHGVPDIRLKLGEVLKDCSDLLSRFHAFYDYKERKETPFLYRDRWSSTDPQQLLSMMKQRYGYPHKSHILMDGNLYDLARRTGAYFPGRPQLRPLPFNDEQLSFNIIDNVDACSKDFFQRQKSFTPGALTFCCSCSAPKILGFKVLYRNEGPRAILDTLISRFGTIPRFLIYDFCCGLFISAIHSLWWAISHVSIVCDHFHSRNHSCSPAYNPRVYNNLNSTNTVAHEQRNRAIQRLGLSLRNCRLNLYVSLLGYQTIVLNIRAQAKGTAVYQTRPKGLHNFDIEWSYFHCLALRCTCCAN